MTLTTEQQARIRIIDDAAKSGVMRFVVAVDGRSLKNVRGIERRFATRRGAQEAGELAVEALLKEEK